MEGAFDAGYDPALELATHAKRKAEEHTAKAKSSLEELDSDLSEPWTEHLRRKEQDIIDQIVRGAETGHYYVLLGAKVGHTLFMIANSIDMALGNWQDYYDL
jgi:hypothetical protein